MNSIEKGKRAERRLARELRKWVDQDGKPIQARRGQQHKGGEDSPDVVTSIPGYHIEVKDDKQCRIGTKFLVEALEQSCDDANGQFPVVVWNEYHRGWRVTWQDRDGPMNPGCPVTTTLEDWLCDLGYTKS